MNIGKKARLNRILNPKTGKTVILPLDHGITCGPMEGIVDIGKTINEASSGGADAVIVHKGLAQTAHENKNRSGLIVHMSASNDLSLTPDNKIIVCSVEEAIKLGADGVSIHLNIGSEGEEQMMKDLGDISRECSQRGMPLLTMVYYRGPNVTNPFDAKALAHIARICAEVGADIIKLPYTGDPESFKEVVNGCNGVPVIIAGGAKVNTPGDLLKMVYDATVVAGGAGLSIGRNIFQAKNVEKIAKALSMIVHDKVSVEEASKILN